MFTEKDINVIFERYSDKEKYEVILRMKGDYIYCDIYVNCGIYQRRIEDLDCREPDYKLEAEIKNRLLKSNILLSMLPTMYCTNKGQKDHQIDGRSLDSLDDLKPRPNLDRPMYLFPDDVVYVLWRL
ncbi:MAG: hypothetical protein C0446_08495 [Chitinophaga sp.]|nr:hypothetical protein [Chitinophaga sp.]